MFSSEKWSLSDKADQIKKMYGLHDGQKIIGKRLTPRMSEVGPNF